MLDGTDTQILTDVELEEALVALVFEGQIGKIKSFDPDDLSSPQLSAILTAAFDVVAQGKPVNSVTMLPRLRGVFAADGTPGLEIVRRLTIRDNPPAIEDIAARLHTLAERRRMRDYLASLAQTATDESISTKALAADAAAHLASMARDDNPESEDSPHIFTMATSFLEFLQSEADPIEITTGFSDLDEATGGWHRKQFTILAARPSMGKSTVALSSLLRTAMAGHGVLYFSLEMPSNQIVSRALCDLAYTEPAIRYAELKPQRVEETKLARLREAAERLRGLPLDIETNGGLSVDDIMERTKRAADAFKKIGKSLDLVVIDHMLKIAPSGRYQGQPVKELDEISQGMCNLALGQNVAVVGLHQLNRNNEDRENQRALLTDLRGSGTLEQDADVVLFCYRPAYRYERLTPNTPEEQEENDLAIASLKYDMEIQIAKQRNGPTTKIDLWCDVASNAVRNKSFR